MKIHPVPLVCILAACEGIWAFVALLSNFDIYKMVHTKLLDSATVHQLE